jgi:zinc transport system ATP-binding protein
MKEKILEVKNLSFSYKDQKVLSDLSFDVYKGDYFGILGPNGSGKTTLLKLCLGLISSKEGTIKIFGEDIKDTAQKNKISYISQKSNAFNVSFPATVQELIYSSLRSVGYDSKSSKKMTSDAIELVGIGHIADRRIGNLSGGQQQKAFIAKAISSKPEIIFLDEPTVGIDYGSEGFFYEAMHMLNQKGVTICMISHDISAITSYANRVACIGEDTFHIHESNDIMDIETSLKKIYGKKMRLVTH